MLVSLCVHVYIFLISCSFAFPQSPLWCLKRARFQIRHVNMVLAFETAPSNNSPTSSLWLLSWLELVSLFLVYSPCSVSAFTHKPSSHPSAVVCGVINPIPPREVLSRQWGVKDKHMFVLWELITPARLLGFLKICVFIYYMLVFLVEWLSLGCREEVDFLVSVHGLPLFSGFSCGAQALGHGLQ